MMQHKTANPSLWAKTKDFFYQRKYTAKVAYGDLILVGILIIYSTVNQIVWEYVHHFSSC